MKVALLSDCYLPRLGGIEVQVHDLAAQLAARGHEVEVFTATPGQRGERHGEVETVDGTAVHRMALRLPGDLPVNPLATRQARRRLREGGFDVAHVHMGVVSPFATDMAEAALGLGLPTAVTWHCLMERSQPVFRVLGHARRWAGRGAALSAVSAAAAASVSAVAGTGTVVRVLPNGVDVGAWAPEPPFHSERAGGGADRAPLRVVSAMRLAPRKRPLALLRVVARAREALRGQADLSLEVLGEGPDRRRLERFAREHGMAAWLHLPGRLSRPELRQRYWDADVYLAPARLEAFGLAALEARTAGLPVLALAGTGVADFVSHGVNGLIAADDEGLAEGLSRLATDPELRTAMARENATVPPSQAWPEVVRQAEAEYARAGAPR